MRVYYDRRKKITRLISKVTIWYSGSGPGLFKEFGAIRGYYDKKSLKTLVASDQGRIQDFKKKSHTPPPAASVPVITQYAEPALETEFKPLGLTNRIRQIT